ncbi:MAG: serine protease [Candidatus Obscuribacterales bacterium]|nr:serine protease [Candidatus Obscuribacterales bacterium]
MDKATGLRESEQDAVKKNNTSTLSELAIDDAYRPVMNVGAIEKNQQASTKVKEEPLEDILKSLPLPPYKPLLAQVLGITTEPQGACDTRPQSPAITGEAIKDTCSLPFSKILDDASKSVTQAIARTLDDVDRNQNGHTDKQEIRFGTAFLLCNDAEDKCYYVTNAHVAGDADSVGLVAADGKTVQYGKIVNRDEAKDLVLVERPPGDNREPVEVGAMPKVKDSVFIVGHPLGSPWDVVSPGQVMELNLDIKMKDPETGKDKQYKGLIQSQVRAVPGNSGGPEFNADGEVIGVKVLANRAGSASIPINDALAEIKELDSASSK